MGSNDRNELTEPVHWEGRQWAVTGHGLETIVGPNHYYIAWQQIPDLDHRGRLHWPEHVFRKKWVRPMDFRRAFTLAIAIYGLHRKLPSDWPRLLDESVARCRVNREIEQRIFAQLPAGKTGYSIDEYLDAAKRAGVVLPDYQ